MAHFAPRLIVLVLAFAAGCGDCRDRSYPCDPGITRCGDECTGGVCLDGGPPRDAGDAGPMPDAELACGELVSGAACSFAGDRCPMCQPEVYSEYFATVRRDGSPGRTLVLPLFPGGYCAVGCDATRLNDECGDCADCNGDALAGNVRLPLYYTSMSYTLSDGVCRETCTPSMSGTGCSREGYTCDLETGTCMEACIDDTQCQIVLEDPEGDGSWDLVDRGEDHAAYCDRVTGRCRTRGTPGASIGDRCTTDGDCPDDGTCLVRPGDAVGICTRLGCQAGAFECDSGTACDVRNAGFEASGCFRTCRVGIEDGTAAVRGASGGNPDCGPGLACVWNGLAERGEERAGSCIVGEYNDRATPNIGAPCSTAADCYSPFGYAECLFAGASGPGTGICTVRSCATFEGASGEVVEGLLPGVEIASPICDPARGELCVNLWWGREVPQPYCLSTCESASECAPRYACTQVLSTPIEFCWPYCYDHGDCRGGSRCESTPGIDCVPGEGGCFCSG